MSSNRSTLSRRGLLRWSAAACMSGWLAPLAFASADDPRRRRSCILLWMNGGPATIDMWDLKPGHDNGGPFREIDTNAPGIRISEHLPRLSRHADKMAIIRSMSTREGDHGRARFLLRSGYTPQGAIQFPAFGAAVARELASATRRFLLMFAFLRQAMPNWSWGADSLDRATTPWYLEPIPPQPWTRLCGCRTSTLTKALHRPTWNAD